METGTKLIKGTAILAESRALTVEEQITFAGILQAHRSVLRTHSTQTGSQALNYEAKQTYAWVLQDVRWIHLVAICTGEEVPGFILFVVRTS